MMAGRRTAQVATKLDLRSAFRHVKLKPEDSRWMTFMMRDVQGRRVAFQWKTLPFGAAVSPACFWEALQPALAAARRRGVRLLAYVDDIMIISDSPAKLDEDLMKLIEALESEGWCIAPEKTYVFAHDRLVFLGLRVDLDRAALAIPNGKIARLRLRCETAMTNERVTLESLQKIVGLLSFMMEAEPAIGLGWKGLLDAMTAAYAAPCRHVWLRGHLAMNLKWWATDGTKFLLEIVDRDRLSETRTALGATDASGDGTGGIAWRDVPAPDLEAWGAQRVDPERDWSDSDKQFTFAEALPPTLIGRSSTTRELAALLALLRRLKTAGWVRSRAAVGEPIATGGPTEEGQAYGLNLIWFSDSTAAVAAVEKLRTKGEEEALTILQSIFRFCIEHDVRVSPRWVSRELGWMPAADFLSRVVGRRAQTEWSVADLDFARIATAADLGCDALDAFATRTNTRCDRFHSRWPEAGSLGPAFSAAWEGTVWAFPPFTMAVRAVDHWMRRSPDSDRLVLVTKRELELPPTPRPSASWALECPLVDCHGRAAPGRPRAGCRPTCSDGRTNRRRAGGDRRNGRLSGSSEGQ
jgi:hypothetical protein